MNRAGDRKPCETKGTRMSPTLHKAKSDKLATDIWSSAERLRGKFKTSEYQSATLPIIVIRRRKCILIK